METYTYKRVGDLDIRADVYLPSVAPPYPVVVWIHGGALILGDRKAIHGRQRDRYLAEGWAVVSIDYRLGPETKLPQIVGDVVDAFAWMRREGPRLFGTDPSRIGVVGQSGGGYLTLMAGCAVEPRVQALVSFYGYGDILADWYAKPDPFYRTQPLVFEPDARAVVGEAELSEEPPNSGRGRFYLYCRQQGRWLHEVGGVDPVAHPEALEPYCPERQADASYPPTLLLHGTADTDVPYSQSVDMAAALRRVGVEHELYTVENGAHGFDGNTSDPRAASAIERAVAFLRRHLSG